MISTLLLCGPDGGARLGPPLSLLWHGRVLVPVRSSPLGAPEWMRYVEDGLAQLRECDALVVELADLVAHEPPETVAKMVLAKEFGKVVVCLVSPRADVQRMDPWLLYHADCFGPTLEKIVQWLRSPLTKPKLAGYRLKVGE